MPSPNLELNTPNAGIAVDTTSTSFMEHPTHAVSYNPPMAASVDRANVIIALAILAALAIFCIISSVMLTRHRGRVNGIRARHLFYYGWYADFEEPPTEPQQQQRHSRWVRIPKLWDVSMTSEDHYRGVDDKDYGPWKNIMPLSAQAIRSPTPPISPALPGCLPGHRRFPPSDHSQRHFKGQVRINVAIAMPRRPQSDEGSESISLQPITEYAIGTVDLPLTRSGRGHQLGS